MEIILTKERIKELINQKGISYTDFCQAIGISKQNLNVYLNAKKKDINMVMKMAEALDMSLYEFLGIPEQSEKDLFGCLYINKKPVLINSKEELFQLINKL